MNFTNLYIDIRMIFGLPRGMTQTKSDEYRARAVNCEERAMVTTDRVARSQWEELAAQWHYMANQAARLRLAPPEDDIEF
jgi:hypothetical protein